MGLFSDEKQRKNTWKGSVQETLFYLSLFLSICHLKQTTLKRSHNYFLTETENHAVPTPGLRWRCCEFTSQKVKEEDLRELTLAHMECSNITL